MDKTLKSYQCGKYSAWIHDAHRVALWSDGNGGFMKVCMSCDAEREQKERDRAEELKKIQPLRIKLESGWGETQVVPLTPPFAVEAAKFGPVAESEECMCLTDAWGTAFHFNSDGLLIGNAGDIFIDDMRPSTKPPAIDGELAL